MSKTTKNEEKALELFPDQTNMECLCQGVREILVKMAEWKDEQNIVDLGGWQTEKPTIDCFCLVETKDFPKNCQYIVAEWDNDAKCFYSESSDMPISYTRYKIIEPNEFLIHR